MGKYRVPHLEFPASSSLIFEFHDSENSSALTESSCPRVHSSSPPADNSAGLTDSSCLPNHPSFPSAEHSGEFSVGGRLGSVNLFELSAQGKGSLEYSSDGIFFGILLATTENDT